MAELSTNLIVRGESIQTLYSQYRSGNLVVNRRYQRKLVWSIEEKQAFVDSLLNQFPVPLFLVAERSSGDGAPLEIIDGLQRLDAVFSFIENAYSVGGKYFDLATLAETKKGLDLGNLVQRSEKLDRNECARFAGYNLPLSVYRAKADDEVDEVFRRINSGGRHLSRQDLRQAGSTAILADLVREIAASVRGDVSLSDIVDLRDMPKISISSIPNAGGIFVDDIPWVKQRVLEREQIRESRDEEIVADLLVSMLVDPVPAYDSRVLDEFYGLGADGGARQGKIAAAIQRDGAAEIRDRFLAVLATFLEIFDEGQYLFATHLFDSPRQRVPRYFEAVFLALDKLMTVDGLEVDDIVGAREALRGVGNAHIDIPGGGGTWTANSKKKNVDVVAGLLLKHTAPRSENSNPALERNALFVENLLRASQVEHALVEFKQGFSELSSPPVLRDENVVEILKTATAMANHGPEAVGYIFVGIADTRQDSDRVSSIVGEEPVPVEGHFVTGLSIDVHLSGSLDELLLWFSDKAKATEVDTQLLAQVLRDMRAVDYMGRTILLLKTTALSSPIPFGDTFYERHASQTVALPGGQVGRLFARFS